MAESSGVIHRVQSDKETYGQIADHYFGRRYLELHLRLFNRRPEPLRKGTTIIIPTHRTVAVAPGQSLENFAETNLSDSGRAGYLAELHGLKGKERSTPKPGTRLRVVGSLGHTVKPGESLKSIARVYYRDDSPRQLKLIMLFNKMSKPALAVGAVLRIPLDLKDFARESVLKRGRRPFEAPPDVAGAIASTPAIAPPPPTPSTADRTAPSPHGPPRKGPAATATDQKRLEEVVEGTERLYLDGAYAACEESAAKLVASAQGASIPIQLEALRLRAFALIALGRPKDGREVFKTMLKLDAHYELDLYRTSPKVLDVFQSVAER